MGSQLPYQGRNLYPLHWQQAVLTMGLQEKSQQAWKSWIVDPKSPVSTWQSWKFQPGDETPKPYFLITISVSLQNTEGVEEGGEISLSSFQGWETNICVEAEAAIWSPQFPAGGKRVHANQNLATDTYNTRAFACALSYPSLWRKTAELQTQEQALIIRQSPASWLACLSLSEPPVYLR